MKCIICNGEFKRLGRAITCSPKCSELRKQQRNKERYNDDRERQIGLVKENYYKNKTTYNQRSRQYHQDNKIELQKKDNIYRKLRRKTDPLFKLKNNIRVRINQALKNNSKLSSSIKLLGIDIQSYRKYLESLFNKNMSWDNYGSYWEIDHIKPLNTFDLLKEQLQAFNYKNTRPLEIFLNRQRPVNGSDLQ